MAKKSKSKVARKSKAKARKSKARPGKAKRTSKIDPQLLQTIRNVYDGSVRRGNRDRPDIVALRSALDELEGKEPSDPRPESVVRAAEEAKAKSRKGRRKTRRKK